MVASSIQDPRLVEGIIWSAHCGPAQLIATVDSEGRQSLAPLGRYLGTAQKPYGGSASINGWANGQQVYLQVIRQVKMNRQQKTTRNWMRETSVALINFVHWGISLKFRHPLRHQDLHSISILGALRRCTILNL